MDEVQRDLDFGACWNDAVALMKANKEIIIVLAGLFIFLPNILFSLIAGEPIIPVGANPQQAQQILMEWFSDNSIYIVLFSILTIIGTLSILFVVLNPARPTVGEALKLSAGLLIFYIVAQIIAGLATFLGFLLIIVPGIYLAIKFSLVGPVAAAENQRNPVDMLRRSWELTKGNSVRIFGFYLLLFVAMIVAMIVFMVIVTLLFMLILPDDMELTAISVVSTVIQAVLTVVMLHVNMAVYRQLSGQTAA